MLSIMHLPRSESFDVAGVAVTRRQHEMTTTVVHHSPIAVIIESNLTPGFCVGYLDKELVKALRRMTIKLRRSQRGDRIMLDYVSQLTRDATRISQRDHERPA